MRKFSANGYLIFKNYPPNVIKGNAQVFSVKQDNRGVIYVANQQGILEYDGTEWNTIKADGKEINCLEVTPEGTVYVGGNTAFGKLITTEKGKTVYKSLLPNIKAEKEHTLYSRINISKEFVYVQNDHNIYVLKDDSLQYTLHSENEIGSFFLHHNNLYAFLKDKGLHILKDREFKPFPNGYVFSNKEVVQITDFGEKTLVITKEHGIFEIDEEKNVIPLGILENYNFRSCLNIEDNLLSIGTNSHGLLVLDREFNIVYEIGSEKGLIDASVRGQFLDREKNLWLATNIGLSKLEIVTPFITFDKNSGIRTTIEAIEKFDDKIYVATLDGVYYFDQSGEISKIEEINFDCYNLRTLAFNGDTLLFISGVNAMYTYNKAGEIREISLGGPYDVRVNPLDSNELIILHYDGLTNVRVDANGQWVSDHYFREFSNDEVFNFIIEDDGTIYIGTKPQDGIYKTHVNIFKDTTIGFEHLYKSKGLKVGATYVFKHENRLYVGADSGLYVKNSDDSFVATDYFGIDFKDTRQSVHRINVDEAGNVWMILFDPANNFTYGYATKQDDKYVWNSKIFMRYAQSIIHAVYHDDDGVTWMGGPKGLIKYDSKLLRDEFVSYPTVIREVKFGEKVLFYGSEVDKFRMPELEYSSTKSVSFKFSALSFFDETATEYSYKLEGYDDNWSPYSNKTYKEYNLQPGTYVFKVKARNIYGQESEVASFKFVIHPPWYRTTWAYVCYFLGFIALIYLSIRFSVRRVKKQNQRLEATVKERTAEIVAQKEIVEKQKELVEEKNQDIMDSIRYAKHIQDAILPSDEFLKDCFSDAFILFKPKDIVSGDFYWVKRKGNKVLFAAVDCTGHGVPGAFVSIVGNNGLNRAVNEFNLIHPGEILDKLTVLVEEAFKQQGAEGSDDVKDGMDIALGVLDLDNNILEYAGANNPLYILRGTELMETKADKQPIGSFENRKPFTTHRFEMQAKDRIILFSDGYADQFGGPKGKKFKYKAFKNLLLDHKDTPFSEFKNLLDNRFEEWRGDLEQIDDVCVVGVEV